MLVFIVEFNHRGTSRKQLRPCIHPSHPDAQEDPELQSSSYLDSSWTRVANGTLGTRRTLKPKGKSISYLQV